MTDLMLGLGCLDGQSMIEMNNLTVGYFPTMMPEIGVYPVPTAPPPSPPLAPAVERQDSQKKS